ncbi:hypothetical protein MUK42_06045 [Musa troglodytarum]|uniref:Uncharacterized protein n=1 Tax=Musa troglodytarum TaxID=320322 RepID=A0A9E7HV43_9LILI|nr:hypothetical protein MUK42_06045 [Musa troglodytarum]
MNDVGCPQDAVVVPLPQFSASAHVSPSLLAVPPPPRNHFSSRLLLTNIDRRRLIVELSRRRQGVEIGNRRCGSPVLPRTEGLARTLETSLEPPRSDVTRRDAPPMAASRSVSHPLPFLDCDSVGFLNP